MRLSEWKDLVDSRSFSPVVSNELAWFGTETDEQTPLLLDRTDPLDELLMAGLPDTPAEQTEFITRLFEVEEELVFDIELAMGQLRSVADEHLYSLKQQRQLMLSAGALMALLGTVLGALTASEVRHRRRVEHAHDAAMDKLGEKAHRDPTTGAWNRRRLEATLDELLAFAHSSPAVRAERTTGETSSTSGGRIRAGRGPSKELMDDVEADADLVVVLAYIDLDHFKAINDVWGHHTGDDVLRTVTGRLQSLAHEGVKFELTRFGGDEFVLYAMTQRPSMDWLQQLGELIIERIGSQMVIGGRNHAVGVSVGIAMSTAESTLASLLLEADSSLILAKREQRGSAIVYNRDISRTGELVHALPEALANGEIACHFQPVFDITTGEIIQVEALARWKRESGEMVSPVAFVPLVESYGLAEKLTSAVLGSVHDFLNRETTPQSIRVWINLSPRELDIANFADRFMTNLARAKVHPSRVGIEITETAAIRDPARLGAELASLRAVGVAVAIDDFGNGYTPLGHLRELAVDAVKLDRSLISNIDADLGNQHLVTGIVGHLRELGTDITAEGVERLEEETWLLSKGITHVQGFLWGRPVAGSNFDWTPRGRESDPQGALVTT